MLYALVRFGRAGLVIVKLIGFDTYPDHIARVDVHPVRQRRIEQLVGGRRLGTWQPEVRALFWVTIITFKVSVFNVNAVPGAIRPGETQTYNAVGSGRYTRGT